MISRLFHSASARDEVSHTLLCYFVLCLRKVTFKYGTVLPVLPGDGCGPLWWWTAAGCHGNKRPPQPRQRSIAPSLCLPWELATMAETSFPAGEPSCL